MATPRHATPTTISALIDRAEALADVGGRRILGLVGAPAAGKSTLSLALQEALGSRAAVVGMDGFHLAGRELHRLGRADRKGAPDTFDVAGYVALLMRLRVRDERAVYAPLFDRDLEEAIAGAVRVDPGVTLVITEGNYLLHSADGWGAVAPLLDETWFLDVMPDHLHARLLTRRMGHGHDPARSADWVRTVDSPNIRTVMASRDRADHILTLDNTSAQASDQRRTPA